MNWKFHVIIGLLFSAIVYVLMGFENLFVIPIIFVYSILPDIDHQNSKITWLLLGTTILITLLGILYQDNVIITGGTIGIATIFLCSIIFDHRGFLHSIIFGLIISMPLILIDWQLTIIAFIAFYSHLFADGLPFKVK